MKKIITVLAISAILSACATQTFTLKSDVAAEKKVEDMQAFFISGLGQEVAVNAAEVCGGADKVAKVETKLNFVDGLLGTLSFGIYTPRTAKVYCAI